jgi:acyl carrier protein
MKPDEIEQKVIKIMCDQLMIPKEAVSREKSIVNDLGADSLDSAELAMEIEDTFDVFIADKDVEKIKTVDDVIKYVEKHAK